MVGSNFIKSCIKFPDNSFKVKYIATKKFIKFEIKYSFANTITLY